MFSSSSFYIHLPSNTQIEGNKTGEFRVRLKNPLRFNSEWVVGLSVVSYPYSWPSIGTNDQQFIRIVWRRPSFLDNVEFLEELLPVTTRIDVPKSKHVNPERLQESIMGWICSSGLEHSQKLNVQIESFSKSIHLDSLDEHDSRNYLIAEAKKRAKFFDALDSHLYIHYSPNYQRFQFFFSDQPLENDNIVKENCIERVEVSQQLGYVLGLEGLHFPKSSSFATYAPDLSGGISSLYVYAPGLIEPVLIGDTSGPLLRIVHVKGKPDDNVEDIYAAVQYQKLLVKEFSEIKIEIRTASGRLVPFEYGSCLLTLHFRKIPYY